MQDPNCPENAGRGEGAPAPRGNPHEREIPLHLATKAILEGAQQSPNAPGMLRSSQLQGEALERYEYLNAALERPVAEALEALCRETMRREALAAVGCAPLVSLNAVDFVASHLMQATARKKGEP